MVSIQKHIINKLTVDVATNNSSSAFDLKDNIDQFLKNDILPYLENYFSTIEADLHSQVIQIPYVSVNVETSSTLNYKELKEDVKRSLTKEIKKKINLAHPHNEEATISTISESKENTLLHFLDTGTSPWWMKSEDVFELSDSEFEDLLTSKSFVLKLQSKLMNGVFRTRLIQQLSDAQIAKVLESISGEQTKKFIDKTILQSFESLTSKDRKLLWECFVDYAIQKDSELLASRLIYQFSYKLSEYITEKNALSQEHQNFLKLSIQVLQRLSSVAQANQALQAIEDYQQISEYIGFNETFAKDSTQEEAKKMTENELTTSKINHEDQDEQKVNPQEKEFPTKQETQKKIESSIPKTSEIQLDQNKAEHLNQVDRNLDEEERSKEQKSAEADQIMTESRGKSKQDITKKVQEFTSDKIKESEQPSNKEELPTKRKDQSHSKQVNKRKSNIDNELDLDKTNLLELNESLSKLISKEDQSLFEELASFQPKQKTIEGDIHISNAGLILLHPYLQPFLKNCELLDDDNKILDEDVAVHLLHYLATKQEQQYENNMVFEKVLCGVPIEQSIQRTVRLSDELKTNAEELLQAVLNNWGVLKNASPDLLRGEFLQRFGKISFKEVNPKITVERKVHDILLDKLPWNIGISRLPWLDYLLFTDW